mgnify:CR=1 FL=1|tara:strand:+ start:542 stop:1186 length:645 start_codon:yes stop_codon:yes gene_type:complete
MTIEAKGTCEILDDDDNNTKEAFTEKEQEKMAKIFKQKDANYRLIKNPFVCRSDFEVRISLDKDPRKHKGNTDFVNLYHTDDDKVHIINELDSQMNYLISKDKVVADKYKEYSTINNYDYEISPEDLNKNSDKKLHKYPIPISFIQINNERDGAVWYKNNYPKIPDDLIPIIARYHWGEPITKKCIKNEKKKINKKLGQKGLKIEHKKVEVVFE